MTTDSRGRNHKMSQGLSTISPLAVLRLALPGMLLVVMLLTVGCSSSDEPEQAASTGEPAEAGNEDFPNLGTVPDQAPESTPKIEREKLLQQLAADRDNAEYTSEILNEDAARVPAAAPPPASTIPPEARGAAESSEGGEEASSETEGASEEQPESAAASLPPPEVAALPATSGNTAAVIFFQPGSDSMTDRDRAILHDVAVLQRRQQVPRLTIVGHSSKAEMSESDTSGGLAMALARANAVAAQLMAEGVPSSAIQTATSSDGAYDESGSQGGTPNQRVEIVLGQ